MHEIIPNLYLSGFHSLPKDGEANNYFIVNCTKDLPMMSSNGIRVAVDDDGHKNSLDSMFLAFEETTRQIHEQLQNGTQVIVHCLAGQQRSPAVVAAYLMKYQGYTLEKSIEYIREKKKDAFFWSVNFRDSLERLRMMIM